MSTRTEPVATDLLRATQAAKRLGISTAELVQLMYARQIDYVLVDGIPHIGDEALKAYLARKG